MWEEIKRDEDTLKSIVQKWKERDDDITDMCISVINISYDQIVNFFCITSDLTEFDEKIFYVQKLIMICLSKYAARKFDLFPNTLKRDDEIKEKEEWKNELDVLLCDRMNNVISEKWHVLWVKTN